MKGAKAIDSLCAVFADQVARRDQGVVVSEKVLAGVFAYLRRDIDPCYDIFVDLTAVDHLEGHRPGGLRCITVSAAARRVSSCGLRSFVAV